MYLQIFLLEWNIGNITFIWTIFTCTVLWALSTFMLFWNHCPHLSPELLNGDSLLPPSCNPWQPPFCFLSVNLSALGTSCKWNHVASAFLWLAHFISHSVLEVHPCCNVSECPSSLRLRSIPLHARTAVCVSFVCRRRCSRLSAVGNPAAVNTLVQ